MRKYYNIDYVEVGKRIAKRRTELGMSQKKLAEKLGCEYSYMSKIENGKAKPGLDLMKLIAVTLDVGVDYFIPGTKTHMQIIDTEIAEELKDCSATERRFIKDFIMRFKKYGFEMAKEYEN